MKNVMFGRVIAKGGSAGIIGSQSSHRLNIDALSQSRRMPWQRQHLKSY
ncbi:hypothetical protein [Erwinia tasmaniensis]|nr:hypothetical protein [Erwinia tasmaniensis]